MILGKILSVAQRSVLKMLSERGGSVDMYVTPDAIGEAGVRGIEMMKNMGLITVTPLLGCGKSQVKLTAAGVNTVTQILRLIK